MISCFSLFVAVGRDLDRFVFGVGLSSSLHNNIVRTHRVSSIWKPIIAMHHIERIKVPIVFRPLAVCALIRCCCMYSYSEIVFCWYSSNSYMIQVKKWYNVFVVHHTADFKKKLYCCCKNMKKGDGDERDDWLSVLSLSLLRVKMNFEQPMIQHTAATYYESIQRER